MMKLHQDLRRASILLVAFGLAASPSIESAAAQRTNGVPGGVVPLEPDPEIPPVDEGLDDFLESAPAGSRRAAALPEDSNGAPEQEPATADDAVAVAAEPFEGSLGAGLAEVERLALAGEVDAALETADRLLAPDLAGRVRAWLERREGRAFRGALDLVEGPLAGPLGALGLDPLASEARSEVHYARGAALRAAERDDDARSSFRAAVGLGGPARLDASYELGHIALMAGEEWRSKIPEIAQASGAPVPAAPPAGQGAHGEADDPLAEARAAYEGALEAFVERLRLDWRHADSRANVELIRRRLEELDDLERKREEEQQEQQEGDPSDQPQDGQEGEPNGDESSESEQDPSEEPPEPSEESEEQESESEEDPSESESNEGDEEEGAEERPEPEPREVHMTQEEMERLLGRLQEHQQRGQEVQEALNARRRRSTARDW